jgi:hypothetical protein
MRIYRSLKDVPELQLLAPQDRMRVWREAQSRKHVTWQRCFVSFIAMSPFFGFVLGLVTAGTSDVMLLTVYFVLLAIAGVPAAYVSFSFQVEAMRPVIRSCLAEAQSETDKVSTGVEN